MRRAIVTAAAVFLVLGTGVGFTHGRTITVDDDGPADFSTIQAAIDDANEGDTVFVALGTYKEDVIMKDGVNLQGAGAEETTIDGCGMYTVVRGANSCRLDGFTITGYVDYDIHGVYCEHAQNLTISHNIIKNNTEYGIFYYGQISSLVISNNIIVGNRSGGIYCSTWEAHPETEALIINNIICDNHHSNQDICLWSGTSPMFVNNIIGGFEYCDHWGSPLFMWNNILSHQTGGSNISVEPMFVARGHYDWDTWTWYDGDYHLKSEARHWDANGGRWTKDEVTSPCIDAGDPMTPIGLEPFPNAGIINMGAYGGTAEASKSYFGNPPCEVIVAGDVNGDCKVNFLDFRLMALHWLEER